MKKKTKTTAQGGKKKQRIKKKHPVAFTVFLVLFCIFASCMLTFIIVSSSVLSYVDSSVNGKKIVDLDNYKSSQSQTSILYAYDAKNKPVELTRLHGEENRIWVDYDKMPDNLINAFVCLEDKRFFEHSGVDWIRTIGVLIKPSLDGQGGSTITQQLIKNLTNQREVTYSRKFNEIIRALNLEQNYSKKDILEAYLNTVYLGAGAYGVETAAETYFGKTVDKLNLVECATLAGITQWPYKYNPYVNYDDCISRQQDCLYYMHAQGKISDKVYEKALKTKIKLADEKSSTNTSNNEKTDILSWYDECVIDQVIADLQSQYGYEYNEAWRMVYYGGLSIYSAEDVRIQNILEDEYETKDSFPYASKDSYGSYPQSAMTIMDYNGRIVAMVGGTGKKTANRGYNRAMDNRAKRQPGSSIKPLSVYSPAIDQGLVTPSSTILEKAITLNGDLWPRNFNGDHGSGEYVTVENALVRSLNTVPVRILKEMLGTKTSLEYCNDKFHLNLTARDEDLSPLAVGGTSTGVTTLEMAAAFATFGNGGRYYKPYSYYKVLDRNGEVLLENTANEPEQAIKAETAKQTLSMLTKAVTQSNGTGYGSKISGFQTFAKTGTTSDNYDKWYCGGTPYYVCAVWYGYDFPSNLKTGGTNPAKSIFHGVFERIHDGLKDKSFDELSADVDDGESSSGGVDTNITAARETTAQHRTEAKTTEKTTEAPKPTQAPTKATTQATTEAPTQAPTEAPTQPPTRPTTDPPTEPPTQAPTQPPTQPSSNSQDEPDQPQIDDEAA